MGKLASGWLLLLLLVPWTCTPAATIHVPDDEPTIQAGIDAASAGDTVLVACGTYYEHDIVMRSGVVLMSETAQPDCVTIDGQQQGRVLYGEGLHSTTRIEGFTITGGRLEYSNGGGMLCLDSSPVIASTTFSGNGGLDGDGGGLCCRDSSPTLLNVRFLDNTASAGGGMACWGGCYTLTNVTFSGNWGEFGAALRCNGAAMTLTDVTFSSNDGAGFGGGMYLDGSQASLTRVVFSGSKAPNYGGGMYCCAAGPWVQLTNVTFSENVADHGGGIYCDSSSLAAAQTIIAFSLSFTAGGEAVCCGGGPNYIGLSCCEIYGNEGGDWVGCIADQYGVNGSISEDPCFCLHANPDQPYALCINSPCATGNNPECGQIGAYPVGCDDYDPCPAEDTTWGAIKATYR